MYSNKLNGIGNFEALAIQPCKPRDSTLPRLLAPFFWNYCWLVLTYSTNELHGVLHTVLKHIITTYEW